MKTIVNLLQLNRILKSSEDILCHLLFGVCHKQRLTSVQLSIIKSYIFNADLHQKQIL